MESKYRNSKNGTRTINHVRLNYFQLRVANNSIVAFHLISTLKGSHAVFTPNFNNWSKSSDPEQYITVMVFSLKTVAVFLNGQLSARLITMI